MHVQQAVAVDGSPLRKSRPYRLAHDVATCTIYIMLSTFSLVSFACFEIFLKAFVFSLHFVGSSLQEKKVKVKT